MVTSVGDVPSQSNIDLSRVANSIYFSSSTTTDLQERLSHAKPRERKVMIENWVVAHLEDFGLDVAFYKGKEFGKLMRCLYSIEGIYNTASSDSRLIGRLSPGNPTERKITLENWVFAHLEDFELDVPFYRSDGFDTVMYCVYRKMQKDAHLDFGMSETRIALSI